MKWILLLVLCACTRGPLKEDHATIQVLDGDQSRMTILESNVPLRAGLSSERNPMLDVFVAEDGRRNRFS